MSKAIGRRPVLGAGVAVAASAFVSACGGSDDASGAGSSSARSARSSASAGQVIVQLSDVPVGGAVSATVGGVAIIVAQPSAGQVVAFSARCTHMGCTVLPAGKELDCPCHESVYDAMTGKNISGPAPRPLAPFAVSVRDGAVVAG